jgi:ADP-ribose pyrophosphatase
MVRGVKVIERRILHSGSVCLRQDKFLLNGNRIDKEIVEHKDSVAIIAIADNNDIVLVTQYRHPAQKVLLEIPAGKIESGETPEQAAIREMAEEIGYFGSLNLLLKWYLAPGYSTEYMHVFVASNLRKIKRGILDDDENIKVKKMKLSLAMKKCLSGEIQDCKTIAALLAYYYNQSD